MKTFTEILREWRDTVTRAKSVLDLEERHIEFVEAELYLASGDLGKNEAESKARFTVIKAGSENYQSAITNRDAAARAYTDATNALKAAEDARREYEDAIAAAAVEGRFGFTIDPADFIRLIDGGRDENN